MKREAELMVVDAAVWTDGARVPGADAIAVGAGRILAVGPRAELAAFEGPATRVVSAAGATVTPGLTDAHIHLVAWARALDQADLTGSASRADALGQLAAFVSEHAGAEVINGFGWAFEGWTEQPDRASLDAICDDRPVLLYSKDTHNLWVNSIALEKAGIDRDTKDPQGGWIDRDGNGDPTGVLRESAAWMIRGVQEHTLASDLALLDRAATRLHAEGITTVHDYESPDAFRALRAHTSGDRPHVRVLMHLTHRGLDDALATGLASGIGDDRFRIGAVKLFSDGTLGSKTAAMLEPYDGTEETGNDLIEAAQLKSLVARALEGGLSLTIHAIGDRATRHTLDAFEASRALIPAVALPPRIEHVQLLDDADLPRFAQLGVAASMQPIHCTSDIELASRYWSKRLDRAYPWASLLESGALLAFGSDAPVELPSAAHGLHAAVTRTRPDHREAFVPRQRIGLDQALQAYTEGPARLAGSWPRLGTLRSGAMADLVVWNMNLHEAEPDRVRDARAAVTVIEGDVVYQSAAEPQGAATQ